MIQRLAISNLGGWTAFLLCVCIFIQGPAESLPYQITQVCLVIIAMLSYMTALFLHSNQEIREIRKNLGIK